MDYAQVRTLIADLIAEAGEASVPPAVRETVAVVAQLAPKDSGRETSVAEVAKRLGLDKSAASRRVKAAISAGYLSNLGTRRGRPARVVAHEDLPAEVVILPTVDTLRG